MESDAASASHYLGSLEEVPLLGAALNGRRRGNRWSQQAREPNLRHGVVGYGTRNVHPEGPCADWMRALGHAKAHNPRSLNLAFTTECRGSSDHGVVPQERFAAASDASTQCASPADSVSSSDEGPERANTAKHASSRPNRTNTVDGLHDFRATAGVTAERLPHHTAPQSGENPVPFRTRPRSKEWVWQEGDLLPKEETAGARLRVDAPQLSSSPRLSLCQLWNHSRHTAPVFKPAFSLVDLWCIGRHAAAQPARPPAKATTAARQPHNSISKRARRRVASSHLV